MRLTRKRAAPPSISQAAVSHAIAAGVEASGRLAAASETRSAAAELAAHEQRTVVAGLRAMREQNHLAQLIMDSIRRGRQA
jgi:hypothetical protein